MARHPSRSPRPRWLWPALSAVATAAVLWALAPALVRWQLQRRVAHYWPGTVAIDRVALHGFRTFELLGVTVRNGTGATVVAFPSIAVAIEKVDWTGPVAARLAIRGLTVGASTPEQSITLPVTMAGAVVTPHRGVLHLDGWRMAYRDVPIAREIAADLESTDSGLTVDGPVGRLLGGSLGVAMRPRQEAIAAGVTGVTVSLEAVSLAAVQGLLPADEQLPRGSATMELAIHRETENGWMANGQLHMEDVDLRGVSVARKLSHFIGVEDLAPLAATEVEIEFGLVGTVATVTQGRMASGLPEIAIEPGSRIDLATGRIDASVVLAAGAKLGELPLLHPVGNLVKSLTRIRIHGHWRDPEETLFSRD